MAELNDGRVRDALFTALHITGPREAIGEFMDNKVSRSQHGGYFGVAETVVEKQF